MIKSARVLFSALMVIILLAVLAISGGPLFGQSTKLPEGSGKDIAENACVICHNASIITQQQLSPAAWTKEVDKMIRWNAPVLPADHDTLVKYLSDHFPPRPDAELTYELPAGAGREAAQASCMNCHDARPITSVHQSRAQWEQTVSQMERWGEKLTPHERAAVIRYLSSAFPTPSN